MSGASPITPQESRNGPDCCSSSHENDSPSDVESKAAKEVLALLHRLASLTHSTTDTAARFVPLIRVGLDDMLTAKQASLWLQCSPTSLNNDAKAGRIPAIPRGNEWRFHPRTILEEGHRHYFLLQKTKLKTATKPTAKPA